MNKARGCLLLLVTACLFGFFAVWFSWESEDSQLRDLPADTFSVASHEYHGFFTSVPEHPYKPPQAQMIDVPDISGGNAIWGGTGRDSRGHIWIGLCAKKNTGASAHVVEYIPDEDLAADRGSVLAKMRQKGLYREGLSQAKIHTRIIQASDGKLYFASMDESGADFDLGTRPPTWGSHLWRLTPSTNAWEHLAAVPEGIIAMTGSSHFIYALGYFGHVLYQYNVKTGRLRSVEVGSVDAHMSRNIFSDFRGHVYVPRMARTGITGGTVQAWLVEYDTELKEVGTTEMQHYFQASPNESHGITAFQPMADGSIVYATSLGYLYRVRPAGSGKALVEKLGWLHPDGERYVSGLFTYAGKRYVMGLTRECKGTDCGKPVQWVVRNLESGFVLPEPLIINSEDPPPLRGCLLYGSVTRDNDGNFYAVGSHWGKQRPLALQISCPPVEARE